MEAVKLDILGYNVSKTQLVSYISLIVTLAGLVTTGVQVFLQVFPQYTTATAGLITLLALVIYLGNKALAFLSNIDSNITAMLTIQKQTRNVKVDDKDKD